MDATENMWWQIADEGVVYHLSRLKEDAIPHDVFVFMGRHHLPNTINLITKLALSFAQKNGASASFLGLSSDNSSRRTRA
jgi:hypothetical protein